MFFIRMTEKSSSQLDVTSGAGGNQLFVPVVVFTDKPGRPRLDERKMCQKQGLSPARLFRSACFFVSPPEKCHFYFFHRNLYRNQCSWSCFNKKHWQIMKLEAGGIGVGRHFLFRHHWLKGKCNRNEHVLMFGLGGMWGENKISSQRQTHVKCIWSYRFNLPENDNW